MSAKRFVLLILFFLAATGAWADILPTPGHRRPSPATLSGRVSMEAAEVEARMKQAGGGNIAVEVECRFDMRCSPEGLDESSMSFPLYYADGTLPRETGFTVTIDGKPAAAVKKDSWPVTDETGARRTQQGYSWPVEFAGGQERRISVRYSLILPGEGGKAQFIYFLRSGALWDGVIGKEKIQVISGKDLKMEVLAPTRLEPSLRTDSKLVWDLVSASPSEDIKLAVSPGAHP